MTLPVVFTANGPSGYNLTKSLRFRGSASATLSRTPASASNQQKWTLSTWVKRGTIYDATLDNYIFGAGSSGSNRFLFGFGNTTENLAVVATNSGSNVLILNTTPVYRDPSAWYHMVLAIDTTQATASNRAILYVNGVQVTAFSTATYPAQNTNLVVNATNAHAFGSRGYAASDYYDGYMTEINFVDGQQLTPSSFGSTNALTGVWQPAKYTGTYGTNGFYLPFTDNSATTPVGLGKDFSGNSGTAIVGTTTSGSNSMTVVSLTGISVGNTVTGPGIPTGTYVTAASVLTVTLSQNATSSNVSQSYTFAGNNWFCNNISLTAGSTYDSMTDVPTLTSATTGNFCTWNPLTKWRGTLSNGNLSMSGTAGDTTGTMSLTGGKWYYECTILGGTNEHNIGFATSSVGASASAGSGIRGAGSYVIYSFNGIFYNSGSASSSLTTFAANDVVMLAYDADNAKIYVGKNGTWLNSAVPASGTGAVSTTATAPLNPIYQFDSGNATGCNTNFGQQPFTYTPPTGFNALNTYNLPTSTIVKGSPNFDVSLYTGTGATQTITTNAQLANGALIWTKTRSNAVNWDTRSTGMTNNYSFLQSNTTNAEETTATQYAMTFSNGSYTVGAGDNINQSTRTFVGYQWALGSAVSNTAGSITSSVQVNASAGFSVVTYTGTAANATVGHGLGVAPSMVIVKRRDSTSNWPSYHKSLGATDGIYLNLTNATTASTLFWNDTAPTSSVFSLGSGSGTNASGGTYVAYCWSPIAGYSAMGSYTGNGSTDGPFVYTGFKPKFVMFKRTDSTGSWHIFDSSRNPYNLTDLNLYANGTNTDTQNNQIDLLSNGFKCRSSDTDDNASGGTVIYMAFAENPFKNALAR